MPRVSGAVALLEAVAAHGVDTIFGLPGGQLDHFFDAIYAAGDRIRLIGTRHEQGAAYMAFGYARSTGRVGTYCVVPGPGVLNTAAALCTAYACNAPVLCLTGQIPSSAIGRGRGELHELPDQLATLRTLTKWAARIDRPAQVAELVAQAFRELTGGRPRPVSLEMPMDIMGLQTQLPDTPAPAPAIPAAAPADSSDIERAAQLIAGAEFPMIYVGGGAVDAGEEIRELAQRLGAPVVSFRAGRGILSDEHELALTLPGGHRLWPKVDLLIGIGSRLMEPLHHWGRAPQLKVVRIDIDPVEMARAGAPDVGLLGDARVTLQALIEALRPRARPSAGRGEAVSAAKLAVAQDIQKVQPQLAYLTAIREALPRDGIFCDEITQCGFASWYGFPVYRPRSHINCGYQGTLGYGFATALGVKVAHPDKPVVAIAGDGGFMFNVQELATAVQYKIGLVTVIFNSNSFSNVKRQQQEWFGNRTIASDLVNPDFVKLAQSFGAAGLRVNSPQELRAALRKAFAEPGPTIIEVPVGQMASPWEFIILPPLATAAREAS
jgi:acetolactate synthase I/II/III large subunit